MSDRITALKPRPRDRVVVTLAGGRFFTIPESAASALSVGDELSDVQVSELDRMDQYFRGKDKALRLLTLRGRTRREIETALASLSISKPIRGGIIAELEEDGLIDDRRFAREYVRTKADVRLLGPHRLRRDLAKLGVAREIVDNVLDEEFESGSQESMAWALVDRKTAGVPIDEKVVRRMAGLLRRKGFDYEVVNRVSYELLRRAGHDATEEF